MKFVFIAEAPDHLARLAWLCDALGVSRSALPCLAEPIAPVPTRSDEAVAAGEGQLVASDRTYGALACLRDLTPKVTTEACISIERCDALAGISFTARHAVCRRTR
jgi:hypothetical protein